METLEPRIKLRLHYTEREEGSEAAGSVSRKQTTPVATNPVVSTFFHVYLERLELFFLLNPGPLIMTVVEPSLRLVNRVSESRERPKPQRTISQAFVHKFEFSSGGYFHEPTTQRTTDRACGRPD